MDTVTLHDAFVPQDCEGKIAPTPAVTAEAGRHVDRPLSCCHHEAGRYVQGGGCTDVGVAGLVQSGGFGSFSKGFGTAAAGLLEAEIVTADGAVRIANACTNPDLFWAIKGGGGGSWGVVTRLTLRTHDLPAFFGGAWGRSTRDRTMLSRLDHALPRLLLPTISSIRTGANKLRSVPTTRSSSLWCARVSTTRAGGGGLAAFLRLG